MSSTLIDTNILVYFFDFQDPGRQDRAISVLHHLEETKQGHLSVQCIAEFFNVATRQIKPVLPDSEAVTQVERWMRAYPVHTLTSLITLEAARGVRDHHLTYYDAQIWASARLNQIPLVFSEDFQDGQVLEGVRFINPFASGFNLDQWI